MCQVNTSSLPDVTVEDILIGIDALPSSTPAFLAVQTLCERYENETSNNTKQFLIGCIVAKILATSLGDIPSAEELIIYLPPELQVIAKGALHTRIYMTGVFDE